jgi:predicted TIM-barrel fold metal-dependent hydrolase
VGKILFAVVVGASLLSSGPGRAADPIPMIDAHSQADQDLNVALLVRLMDQGGVKRTILSNRGGLQPKQLVAMAAAHPDRITSSMEVKSRRLYLSGKPEFFRRLEEMGKEPRYGAISEALLWHQAKGGQRRGASQRAGQGQRAEGRGQGGPRQARRGGRAPDFESGGAPAGAGRRAGDMVPEFDLPIEAPQVQAVLKMALARNWPFVAHYEFRSLNKERYAARMKELKDLLRAHPDHPIVLIHMGQLRADEAAGLISEFRNIYFMTSHANPVFEAVGGGYGWTKLFEGRKLAPAWKKLAVANPDRFILAFDCVLKRHWQPQFYLAQAKLWQEALADLPTDAAHAIAHRNAERLWALSPL